MIKFKTFIDEMALDLGRTFSPIERYSYTKKRYFDNSKVYPHHGYPISDNKNIEVKVNKTPTSIDYYTNNNDTNETLHMSSIKKHQPTQSLPFVHEEQTKVDRTKSDILPKGYATDFIYNHFKTSNIPLRSSDSQYTTGRDMWKRLVTKALTDGHHVYYHDGSFLHKSTKDNIDSHLSSYFGGNKPHDESFQNKHIILSKTIL
jgi:hypothetical protein